MKNTSKKNKINIFLLFLAIFFTVVTIYKEVEVFNKTELNNLACGWPMQYLSSGYLESVLDPPYPWTDSCANLLGHDFHDSYNVEWANLTFNVVFYYLLFLEALYVSRKLTRKTEQKK